MVIFYEGRNLCITNSRTEISENSQRPQTKQLERGKKKNRVIVEKGCHGEVNSSVIEFRSL